MAPLSFPSAWSPNAGKPSYSVGELWPGAPERMDNFPDFENFRVVDSTGQEGAAQAHGFGQGSFQYGDKSYDFIESSFLIKASRLRIPAMTSEIILDVLRFENEWSERAQDMVPVKVETPLRFDVAED